MMNLTPDKPCDSCASMLVPRNLALGHKVPIDAHYVCLKCRRPYRWQASRRAWSRSFP